MQKFSSAAYLALKFMHVLAFGTDTLVVQSFALAEQAGNSTLPVLNCSKCKFKSIMFFFPDKRTTYILQCFILEACKHLWDGGTKGVDCRDYISLETRRVTWTPHKTCFDFHQRCCTGAYTASVRDGGCQLHVSSTDNGATAGSAHRNGRGGRQVAVFFIMMSQLQPRVFK